MIKVRSLMILAPYIKYTSNKIRYIILFFTVILNRMKIISKNELLAPGSNLGSFDYKINYAMEIFVDLLKINFLKFEHRTSEFQKNVCEILKRFIL